SHIGSASADCGNNLPYNIGASPQGRTVSSLRKEEAQERKVLTKDPLASLLKEPLLEDLTQGAECTIWGHQILAILQGSVVFVSGGDDQVVNVKAVQYEGGWEGQEEENDLYVIQPQSLEESNYDSLKGPSSCISSLNEPGAVFVDRILGETPRLRVAPVNDHRFSSILYL
ncbi:hypothetical protein FOZ63_031426, partial [Perkinsus olseni]